MAGRTLSTEPLIDPTAKLQQATLGAWDWSHDALHAALPDFRKLAIEDFLDKYEAASTVPAIDARRSAAL